MLRTRRLIVRLLGSRVIKDATPLGMIVLANEMGKCRSIQVTEVVTL